MTHPGDRPRGAPPAAKPALAAWYLLVGMTCVGIAEFLPLFTGGDHGAFFMVGWPVAVAVIIPIIGGIGAGKLWAVRLFRWTVYGAAACYLPILGIAIYAFLGNAPREHDPLAPYMAEMQFIFSVVEAIALYVLFRAFRRVRWLDPRSLPKEWEPPGRPVRFP